jgi:hypothetical protein
MPLVVRKALAKAVGNDALLDGISIPLLNETYLPSQFKKVHGHRQKFPRILYSQSLFTTLLAELRGLGQNCLDSSFRLAMSRIIHHSSIFLSRLIILSLCYCLKLTIIYDFRHVMITSCCIAME